MAALGVVTAVHSHAHEQVTLVERGRVEFVIDGQARTAAAGDIPVFPPHCEHGARLVVGANQIGSHGEHARCFAHTGMNIHAEGGEFGSRKVLGVDLLAV